ncbi:MAG: PmoA family protein, partial [Armatimonadota bacterium]|nr:PmoA family protein [Armatimonadota bacterium]
TQECASDSPLKLPKYHYGGLGFRGHWDWDGKDNAFFLTSEGETDRLKANETRARWCHIGGRVDGELTGIAVFDHPDNFRAPQPMRLHPSEPFFCYAPPQLGDWEIAPGKPYVARYRFIVQDGAPDKAELDRLWNDYAHPPEVKVEAE